MDDKLCNERHERINDCLERYERRLNAHGDKIGVLEDFKSGTVVEIRNLVEQIKALVAAFKWGTGLTITTLLAFFVWYIQRGG